MGRVMLIRTALEELRRSVSDAAGADVADEVLFRLGRAMGEGRARSGRVSELRDPEERLRQGLRQLPVLGLGRAVIERFQHDPEDHECRIYGVIHDPVELASAHREGWSPEGTACGITAGFLTGLASTATGLDLVCSPFRCPEECFTGACDTPGCRFVIQPAHLVRSAPRGEPAPSGAARFFLGAVGGSLGGGDIDLAGLLERTGDAFVLIDSNDVVRFWNHAAEEMFGYPREEVVGRKAGLIVPEDLHESGELAWFRAQLEARGRVDNHLTRRVTADGRTLDVSISRTVLHDSQGQPIGSAAVLRDVTAQRRTEAELQEARKLAVIGQLAASVAHEVKNPLAGILGAVQILTRGDLPPAERIEVLAEVEAEVRRVDATIQDLLRFARPTPPRRGPMDLAEVVDGALQPLRHDPEVARCALVVEVPEGLMADLDPFLFAQTLQNLVLNAAQAVGEGGTITLRGLAVPGGTRLEVEDDGPGIPEHARADLFEPFFTTKARGTGLGLSIARKNVESHEGTLEYRPGAGGGACFVIDLPPSRG